MSALLSKTDCFEDNIQSQSQSQLSPQHSKLWQWRPFPLLHIKVRKKVNQKQKYKEVNQGHPFHYPPPPLPSIKCGPSVVMSPHHLCQNVNVNHHFTAHLMVTHCAVLCWVIPFWRMTSTESLIIVYFCPGELQYNPSTTGIFLVSIQYLKLTWQMLIFGLLWPVLAAALPPNTMLPHFHICEKYLSNYFAPYLLVNILIG